MKYMKYLKWSTFLLAGCGECECVHTPGAYQNTFGWHQECPVKEQEPAASSETEDADGDVLLGTYAECTAVCSYTLELPYSQLYTCFNPDLVGGWDPLTPQAINDNCASSGGSGSCVIPLYTQCPDPVITGSYPPECVLTEECDELEQDTTSSTVVMPVVSEGSCTWDFTDAYFDPATTVQSEVSNLYSDIESFCAISPSPVTPLDSNIHVTAYGVRICGNESCEFKEDPSARVYHPSAEYNFQINPALSTVTSWAPYGSDTSAVYGSIAVNTTGQDTFLRGIGQVDDMSYPTVGLNFTHLNIIWDAPISFNGTSGTFVVTPSAFQAGSAAAYMDINGYQYTAHSWLSSNLSGTYDLSSMTWTLSVTDNGINFGTTLYLTGTIVVP